MLLVSGALTSWSTSRWQKELDRATAADSKDLHLAAELLAECGESAVPALLEMFQSNRADEGKTDRDVRRLVTLRILLIDYGNDLVELVPFLGKALLDPDHQEDAAAVLGLIGPPARDALEDVMALLDEASPDVRRAAAFACGTIDPIAARLRVFAALGREYNPGVRSALALSLLRCSRPSASTFAESAGRLFDVDLVRAAERIAIEVEAGVQAGHLPDIRWFDGQPASPVRVPHGLRWGDSLEYVRRVLGGHAEESHSAEIEGGLDLRVRENIIADLNAKTSYGFGRYGLQQVVTEIERGERGSLDLAHQALLGHLIAELSQIDVTIDTPGRESQGNYLGPTMSDGWIRGDSLLALMARSPDPRRHAVESLCLTYRPRVKLPVENAMESSSSTQGAPEPPAQVTGVSPRMQEYIESLSRQSASEPRRITAEEYIRSQRPDPTPLPPRRPLSPIPTRAPGMTNFKLHSTWKGIN